MTDYIGIDPSYSGLATVVLDGQSGEVKFTTLHEYPLKKYESKGARLDAVAKDVIDDLYHLDEVGMVAMEGYAFHSTHGREQAGELQGVIHLALRDIRIDNPVIQPSPQSVKKYALGAGKSQAKDQMALGVYKKWNVDLGDNNLTDAFVLAQIARDYHLFKTDGRIPIHAYEMDVIRKIAEKK